MSHSAKSTVEFVALGLKEVHKLTSEWSLWALKLLLYKKKLTLGSSIVEEFDLLNWQADSGQMLFGIFCFDSEHTPPPVTRHPSWNASFTEGAEEFYHGKINWMEYFSRAGHQPSSFYDAVPPPSGVSERSLTSEDPTGAEMIAGVEDLLLDSHSSFALPPRLHCHSRRSRGKLTRLMNLNPVMRGVTGRRCFVLRGLQD